MSFNRVDISGNLTRDPELRATPAGTQVLHFGVAVNDRRRNQQSGEWEDHPNFVDCVVFGNRAESMSRILRKGMKVAIDGRLRYSSWEKDGQRRSKLEVVVEEIELMSQNPNVQQAQQRAPQDYAPQAYQQAPAPQPAQGYRNPPAAPQRPAAAPAPAPQAYAPQSYQQAPVPQAYQQTPAPQQADVYDEDIPF